MRTKMWLTELFSVFHHKAITTRHIIKNFEVMEKKQLRINQTDIKYYLTVKTKSRNNHKTIFVEQKEGYSGIPR